MNDHSIFSILAVQCGYHFSESGLVEEKLPSMDQLLTSQGLRVEVAQTIKLSDSYLLTGCVG